MENSKIVMLSGIYLILGMYALSFNSANTESGKSVIKSASKTQAEHLARTGISIALKTMGNVSTNKIITSQLVFISSDTVQYSASPVSGLPPSETQIVSIGKVGGESVTMTAVCSFDRGRWRITRIYTVPSA